VIELAAHGEEQENFRRLPDAHFFAHLRERAGSSRSENGEQ
jgi:hypothetical protein